MEEKNQGAAAPRTPSELLAPAGMIFICGACGKRSRGQYGTGGDKWWDSSCSVNATLIEDVPLDVPRPWRVVLKSKHEVPRFLTEAHLTTREKAEEVRALMQAHDPSYEYSVTDEEEDPEAEMRAMFADMDRRLEKLRESYGPKAPASAAPEAVSDRTAAQGEEK